VPRLNALIEGGGEEGGTEPWVEDGGGDDGAPGKREKECAGGGEGIFVGGLKGSFSRKGVIAGRAVGWLVVMGKGWRVPAAGTLLF
jgi:hypothetical protein